MSSSAVQRTKDCLSTCCSLKFLSNRVHILDKFYHVVTEIWEISSTDLNSSGHLHIALRFPRSLCDWCGKQTKFQIKIWILFIAKHLNPDNLQKANMVLSQRATYHHAMSQKRWNSNWLHQFSNGFNVRWNRKSVSVSRLRYMGDLRSRLLFFLSL